ncbi:MAG: hypothetical protein HWD60_02400 [Defluviicoccus sp.]|nr:MAG: hypothetical protein HWD60_02400 [Defluviicoccus sp.]
MLRHDSISREMHGAGRDFAATFTIAQFDTIACMSLDRISGWRSTADPTDIQLDARRSVAGEKQALGMLAHHYGSSAGKRSV